MKRIFMIVLSICLSASFCVSFASNISAQEGEMIFELSEDGTYYILKDVGVGVKDVVIPDEYNGLPVRQVGDTTWEEGVDDLFWDKPFYNSKDTIETITLGENVYTLIT